MSTSELSKGGYNSQQLSAFKARRLVKKIIKTITILLVLSLIVFAFMNYFSDLPRERHAKKYNYFEKVWLGAKRFWSGAFLTITAEHEDPFTQMPIVELYIKGKRLDKLNENLPASGKREQKAELKIGAEIFKAKARYRGDSINHWAFPNKSWRVILAKDKTHNDTHVFNFNVPREKSQLSNWLGYEIARAFGDILVPDTNYVHFRLNRRFDGVRLLLEQPDLEFIEKRNLPPGKIYVGDITSENIYGDQPRKRIYEDVSAWEVISSTPDESNREMAELIHIIANEHNPYKFHEKMQKILDLPAMIKYIAMLDLVGSVHIDATHNGKYFFNSATGRFTPIAWDTVAYFWRDRRGIDLAPNPLFRVLMSNPEFRELKDRYLWDLLQTALTADEIHRVIDQKVAEIKNDVEAFALKIHANDKGIHHISNEEWHESVADMKRGIQSRNDKFINALTKNDTSFKLVQDPQEKQKLLLGVRVASNAGAYLNRIKVKFPEGQHAQLNLTRRGLEDSGAKQTPIEVKLVQGAAAIKLKDHLFSKRGYKRRHAEPTLVPSLYVYELNLDQEVAALPEITLYMENAITGKKFKAPVNNSISIEKHKTNSVWWKPDDFMQGKNHQFSGNVRLSETLHLDKYSSLKVMPGTRIQLEPGVSIIAEGAKIEALGTPEAPIVFEKATAGNWGSIVGFNAANLKLRNVKLSGGSSAQHNTVRFNSALSIHNANAEVLDSDFETTVTVRDSNLKIQNVRFNTVFSNPLIVENSSLTSDNLTFDQIEAVHLPEYVNQDAVGTDGRWEREYKFTFLNFDASANDAFDVAEEIRLALAEKVNDKSSWNINKHVENNLYVDPAVKDFIFRDIYFDTNDQLNYKNSISYRYRNRYPSSNAYNYHNKRHYRSRYWPYRLEFQAKTRREELGNGFSRTLEHRFEFRKESAPFSEASLPPTPPWDTDLFVPYFQLGKFDGMLTYPAKAVMEFLKEKGNKGSLKFEASTVLLTDRYRQHLNIKTPWGSGPNPEQSYIISLDHSKVYNPKNYMMFLEARKLGNRKFPEPQPDAHILEIEVEFERNVSDVLDREIESAKTAGDLEKVENLSKVREAFLADQENIMNVIMEYFAQKGIRIEPIGKSKYVQAIELLQNKS